MNVFQRIAFLWNKRKQEILQKKYNEALGVYRKAYRSAITLARCDKEVIALEERGDLINKNLNTMSCGTALIAELEKATHDIEQIQAAFRNALPLL